MGKIKTIRERIGETEKQETDTHIQSPQDILSQEQNEKFQSENLDKNITFISEAPSKSYSYNSFTNKNMSTKRFHT